MPQIIIVADTPETSATAVQMREWIAPWLLEDQHYSAQLIERVRWAAQDAAAIEAASPM